jgi:glycosyltransferase involved in cell wall biosynthesis
MRVLLVVDWFLKYAVEQAGGLCAAGADVRVLCRDHSTEFGGNADEWGLYAERIVQDTGHAPLVIRGRTMSLGAARDAGRALRSARAWSPDVVHAHPSVDPWLYVATPPRPLVMTIHDPSPHPGQPRHGIARRAVGNLWQRRAAGFILHGAELRRAFLDQAHGRAVTVIPHGVKPAAAPYPIPAGPTILFFGRLEPYKGLGVLMRAMNAVWVRRPDVELIVAGTGPSETDITDDPRIRKLTGYVPEAALDGLFSEARLLVAPYTEGSQSGVVSLACARGVPSIVSAVGALATLVVEPSQVVPPGDPDALARSLLQHLEHSAALRTATYEKAVRDLSWPVVGEQTIRFYRELTGR